MEHTMKFMEQRKKIIILSVMLAADQFIKCIMNTFFRDFDYSFHDLIGFRVYLNQDELSIFNSELGLQVSMNVLVFINIAAFVIFEYAIWLLKKDGSYNKVIKIGFLLLEGGMVCSLIDKIFWKGSLDYMIVFHSIVDLKDIYLFAGAALCIIGLVPVAASQKKRSSHKEGEKIWRNIKK